MATKGKGMKEFICGAIISFTIIFLAFLYALNSPDNSVTPATNYTMDGVK